jgi:hypothetical protein
MSYRFPEIPVKVLIISLANLPLKLTYLKALNPKLTTTNIKMSGNDGVY